MDIKGEYSGLDAHPASSSARLQLYAGQTHHVPGERKTRRALQTHGKQANSDWSVYMSVQHELRVEPDSLVVPVCLACRVLLALR